MSAERRKVTRIITRLNIGGPSRHVGILNTELQRHGFDSELLVGREGPDEGHIPVRGRVQRIPTLQRQISPSNDVRAYFALRSHLATQEPHIVHTHMAKAGALGRVAAAEAGVPGIVHTYHGHVLDGYFPRFVEGRFLQVERWLATRSHALIAVSSAVRDSLLEKKIGTSSQWSVIPEIPDLCSLIDLVPSKARKTVSIGIVGRLTAIKDHMTFLRAMVHVAASSPECRFLIIGDGELRAPLMEAAKPLGESVRFLGWVENLAEIYSDLDIVVLTSRNEGLPLTLMEASAASLPTVATDVGGVSDVVKHGKTGFLVRAGDSDEIAERVLQLVRSPELRSQFGAAGRQWVRTEFSAQRLVAQVASLYDSLIRS